jgi:ATP phosphoribosyltransferase regulatory subunit
MESSTIRALDRWLLPEGIEEVLPPAAQRLDSLRRSVLDLFRSWGYELVIPPVVEYLESLLTGSGSDLDLRTFKLIDQLSGRMMGVRADMTPQAARVDAHLLGRDVPVRLCYLGTVLHTRPQALGASRCPMQLGAELFGHAGIDSDVEVFSLMLETLELSGIRDVHVDLGHVGLFRGLAELAGLDREQERLLFDALQRKACPEIDTLLEGLNLSARNQEMLLALASLNGGEEVLVEAREALGGCHRGVDAALDELDAIAAAIHARRPGLPVYFDLAELRGYHYHTGVVFAAFAPGYGQEIARGGRYDEIGKVFGRARPATGFSTDLRILMGLTSARGDDRGGVFAPFNDDPALHAMVHELRGRGERVVAELPGQVGGAAEMNCNRQLIRRDGDWEIVAV